MSIRAVAGAVVASIALLAVACSSSASSKAGPTTTAAPSAALQLGKENLSTAPGPGPEVTVSAGSRDTQGVTPTQISVGGLAAITGPLGNQYSGIFDGAEAYFAELNAQGGVNGRTIKYVAKLDDATNPSRNAAQARALNEEYGAFAVVGVASPFFPSGKYLGAEGVPTFGWNVNPEWEGPPGLFGEKGSALDFTGPEPGFPYLVKKIGATNVGTIAYGVPQSSDCSTGYVNSLHKYGMKTTFQDVNLPFGATDITADVDRMQQAHIDMIATCLDDTGNTLVSRSLQQANFNIKQYWPNGYSAATLAKFADVMEGVYVYANHVPFEAANTSPGSQQFLAAMQKYEPGKPISEVALAGWINADLFTQGLRMIGPNVGRAALINAINSTRSFTANGIFSSKAPVDWYYAHHVLPRAPHPDCSAYIQVQHGKFVPIFGTPSDPFVCIDHLTATLPN